MPLNIVDIQDNMEPDGRHGNLPSDANSTQNICGYSDPNYISMNHKMSMTLGQLRQFSPQWIDHRTHPIIVIIGKKRVGKSTIIKDLIWHAKDTITDTLIFVDIGDITREYHGMICEENNHSQYSDHAIIGFMKRNDNLIDDTKKMIVLDDVVYKGELSTKEMKRLIVDHSSRAASIIVSVQGPFLMVPSLKSQTDYTFVFKIGSSHYRLLFDKYCRAFPTFENFCSVMDSLNDEMIDIHTCIVIDNNAEFPNNVFLYRAEMRGFDFP
jgi:hypothetical protein